jgi:hypothetical protein
MKFLGALAFLIGFTVTFVNGIWFYESFKHYQQIVVIDTVNKAIMDHNTEIMDARLDRCMRSQI